MTTETQPEQALSLKQGLALLAIHAFGLLPLGLARGLGSFFGRVMWWTQAREAKVTLRNLELCYPQMPAAERMQLAKRSLRETGKLAAEILVIRQRDIAWLQKRIVAVHGEEHMKNEIAKGKGVIFLAPHLGNWEVLSLLLPLYGELTALYQPPRQAFLEPVIKKAREKTGATLVPTNRRGIASLLKSLREGGITAVLPDQNPAKGNGEFAPFFSIPAYTMTSVHGFVERSESAVIYGFVKRVAKGFEVFFLPADQEIYSDDRQQSLVALNKGVERCVSYCPEQYQWEYKRFKKQPENSPYLYR